MLDSTFLHIQGIGSKTEQKIWNYGILTWDDFSATEPLFLSKPKRHFISDQLELARQYLSAKPIYFTDRLPASQHWRIFPHFRDRTAFLDIETTGLDSFRNTITTIALYDGTNIYTYVYDDNLEEFVKDISKYDVLVTFNGKCFDLPFLENYFGIKLNKAHIDLRYVLRSLGYSGGLKKCEKYFGIDRGNLDGVDGYFAVLLWHEYQSTGNPKALETLLAYNIEDVVNLEFLMIEAYNKNLENTPFQNSYRVTPAITPPLKYFPDRDLVEHLKSEYGLMQRF